jgi:Kef-type K+ transport system membrane component KefB
MDYFSKLFANASASGASGSPYQLLLPVGLILVIAKLLSIWFSKLKVPQVIGFLVAGLLIGLITLIPGQTILTDYTNSGISILAKFGVVLILFSAGVETDLKQVKAVGFASIVITSLGVIVPLALGFLVAYLFRVYGGMEPAFLTAGVNPIYSDLYYGVILSATSVSITVATLKEIGKLNSKEGQAIISAAIIDDVIGIILLSLVISLSGTSEGSSGEYNLLLLVLNACGVTSLNAGLQVLVIILNMAFFFLLSWGFSFLVRKFFNFLGTKYPHHIRIPIFSMAFCFLWAYLSQEFFEIADITGAYVAGLILSSTTPKQYIDHRAETTANVFFVPIFFASVAMKMFSANADFSSTLFIWFGICWVILGLLGKIVGAGSGALMCRFSFKDSVKVGVGMMARAEVLIVTAQTGVEAHLVDGKIIPYTLLLILISSFITPILLKVLYKGELDMALATPGAPIKNEAGEAAPSQNAVPDSNPANDQPVSGNK